MTMNEIIKRKEQLDQALRAAVSTMERKDTIPFIRDEIHKNQEACPHYSTEYNWTIVNDICPYCGKKLG